MRPGLGYLTLGIAIGGIAGYFAAPRDPPPPPPGAETSRPPEPVPAPPEEAAVATTPATAARPTAPAAIALIPRVPEASAHPTPSALATENAGLRALVATLQSRLEQEQRVAALEHGEPLAAPATLPAKFEADAVRTMTTDALRQAGFDGAQVTTVDCTEYPCIVYGEGMGNRNDFEKLTKSGAFGPYAEDGHNAYGWEQGGKSPDHPLHQYFGLALFPSEERVARGEALRKRLDYRTKLMQESFGEN